MAPSLDKSSVCLEDLVARLFQQLHFGSLLVTLTSSVIGFLVFLVSSKISSSVPLQVHVGSILVLFWFHFGRILVPSRFLSGAISVLFGSVLVLFGLSLETWGPSAANKPYFSFNLFLEPWVQFLANKLIFWEDFAAEWPGPWP